MTSPGETPIGQERPGVEVAIAELGEMVLRGAWPEEEREQREQAFGEAVKTVYVAAANDDERDMLALSEPQWRWRLFGRPGDPLPPAMHLVQWMGREGMLLQAATSYGALRARKYAADLATAHLAPFVQERSSNLQRRVAELEAKAEEVAAAMPIYQLLRSFKPDKDGAVQPLTLPERTAREEEIKHEGMLRAAAMGIVFSPQEMSQREAGHYTVRRELAALSFQDSIYPAKDGQDDPWEKIRQMVLREHEAGYLHESVTIVESRWDADNFYVTIAHEDKRYPSSRRIVGVAEDVIDNLYRGRSQHVLARPGDECKKMMAMAFQFPPADTYEVELAKAMATTRDNLLKKVIFGHAGMADGPVSYNRNGYFTEDVIHAELSQSSGLVTPWEAFTVWAEEHSERWHDVPPPEMRHGIDFMSQDERMWRSQTIVGLARGDIEEARVVSTGPPLAADFPSTPLESCTAELAFPASQFGAYEPILPGYTLLAAFKRGPNQHYQYERALYDPLAFGGQLYTPLSQSKRNMVADMCASIGLDDVATRLRNDEHSTQGLVHLLKMYSTYAYENPAGDLSGPVPFEDLKQFVVDGVYHCQCTGASYLLGHLLEAIYADDPSIEIRTVSGLVVPDTLDENPISALMHVQNFVYKNGKLIAVLDAQPPVYESAFAGVGRQLFQEEPDAPAEKIDPPKQYSAGAPVFTHEEAMPTHPFDRLRQEFYASLQLQYSAPDMSTLYEKLAGLRNAAEDPIMQAVQLFRQDEAAIEPNDVAKVLKYARSLRAFPAGERRGLGIAYYSDGALDMLIDNLVGLYQLRSSQTVGGAGQATT